MEGIRMGDEHIVDSIISAPNKAKKFVAAIEKAPDFEVKRLHKVLKVFIAEALNFFFVLNAKCVDKILKRFALQLPTTFNLPKKVQFIGTRHSFECFREASTNIFPFLVYVLIDFFVYHSTSGTEAKFRVFREGMTKGATDQTIKKSAIEFQFVVNVWLHCLQVVFSDRMPFFAVSGKKVAQKIEDDVAFAVMIFKVKPMREK